MQAVSNISKTAAANLHAAQELRKHQRRRTRLLLLLPALGIIGIFGLFPLSIALVYSFLEPGTYGGVEWVFSTDAYVQFLFERDIFDETLKVKRRKRLIQQQNLGPWCQSAGKGHALLLPA